MKKLILSIAIVLTLNSCTTPEVENNQTTQGLIHDNLVGKYKENFSTTIYLEVKKNRIILYNQNAKDNIGNEIIVTSQNCLVTDENNVQIKYNDTTKITFVRSGSVQPYINKRHISNSGPNSVFWYYNDLVKVVN
ncbi:hypothetical protein [Flavobacterium sp.]|jgi:hypothetical protein|uniref:hypothetical protein n=1 Tax=Flavobacterium sp. TaxID=239 RepID=UPI0037C1A4D2